ncbi:MAG: diguanylate cyclase domain-containing protein [Hyphomicrobiales bacterium]
MLIAFDVDDFKRVNDSIGHAQGDALLRAIARRLRRDYGDCAAISRLGGDEFDDVRRPAAGRLRDRRLRRRAA